MRRWAWLLPALLPGLSAAEERALTLDAPVVEGPRATLSGAQTPLEVPRLDAALPLAPLSAASFDAKLAAPAASAASAALATAKPLSASAQAPLAEAALSPQAAQKAAAPESLEQAALDASIRFDKALAAADDDGETAVWKLRFGAAQSAEYRRARDASRRAGWSEGREALQSAALAMYASAGVQAEPVTAKNREGKDSPGVRVMPVKGASPLNELAHELKKNLGVDLDYVPERTRDAVAAFNGREKRILAPHLDQPEFFLSLLHEARHAYYSALLAKGEVRLFHAAIVARPGRRISSYAQAYASYMSLEELSTYPKTLKHLLSALRDAAPEERWRMAALAQSRIGHYLEFLGTTLVVGKQIAQAKPVQMSAEDAEARGLDAFPSGAYFQLDLPQAVVYLPLERGEARTWLQKKLGAADKLAVESVRLKSSSLARLAEDAVPIAGAYRDAVASGDYAEAGRQADRLIKLTLEADRDWRLSYAALLARER